MRSSYKLNIYPFSVKRFKIHYTYAKILKNDLKSYKLGFIQNKALIANFNLSETLNIYNFCSNGLVTVVKNISIKRKQKKIKKKKPFLSLTKKQKQKIKINKLHKLIRPGSVLFKKNTSCPRNVKITHDLLMYDSRYLVHDGYSWHFITPSKLTLGFITGAICFKTRVLSPIPFDKKGRIFSGMAQKSTVKIKKLKVKRKK